MCPDYPTLGCALRIFSSFQVPLSSFSSWKWKWKSQCKEEFHKSKGWSYPALTYLSILLSPLFLIRSARLWPILLLLKTKWISVGISVTNLLLFCLFPSDIARCMCRIVANMSIFQPVTLWDKCFPVAAVERQWIYKDLQWRWWREEVAQIWTNWVCGGS